MVEKAKYIWMDGKLVNWDDAKVHVWTHALHYGTGAFEGIRGYWSNEKNNMFIFRLKEHMERLEKSSKPYFMDDIFKKEEGGYSLEELCNESKRLINSCELKRDVYIRPLVYKGEGTFGLYSIPAKTRILISVIPFDKYLDDSRGQRVCISSFRRIHASQVPPEAKVAGNYINSIRAKNFAKQNNFDEAIMLDKDGFVSEGSGENLFLVEGGVLVTPDKTSSILPGITRDSVIEIAKDLGFTVEERRVGSFELYACDEAFFTGTAAEVTWIESIDNHKVGNGKMGDVSKKIRKEFFEIVRAKKLPEKFKNWLTEVY